MSYNTPQPGRRLPPPKPTNWFDRHKAWTAVLVGAGVVAFAFMFSAGVTSGDANPSEAATVPTVADDVAAKAACEEHVKDRLKAPSTAVFYDTVAKHGRFDRWNVIGYVESENGFGGMVQNWYLCTVAEDAGQWELKHLSGLTN